MFKVNQYLDAVEPGASDSRKIAFVAILLQDRASTWYMHLLDTGATFSSWNGQEETSFASQIHEEFVDINYVRQLKLKLNKLTMANCGGVK